MASVMSMKALYVLLSLLQCALHFQGRGFNGTRRGKCPKKCQCSSSSLMMVYCEQGPGKTALTQLPANLPEQVEFLSLANNAIANVTRTDFSNLNRLSTLKLRGNRLIGLPAGIFRDMRAIRSLNLGENRLSSLPPNVFQGLRTLRELFLDGNELRRFSDSLFQNLLSLKYLHLYNNKIETLPKHMFRGTYSLRSLLLDNNLLTSLPARLFQGQRSLIRLTFSDNQIKNLNTELFKPIASTLKVLKLENNSLRFLPRGVFSRLSPQILVSLHGNPFHCNCKLKWLKHWLRRRGVRIFDRALIRCASPPNLAGKMITMVPDIAFICRKGGWTPWGSWTPCSRTCGQGMQKSIRTCTNPTPEEGGLYCKGTSIRFRFCVHNPACPVQYSVWSSWSNWGQCSKTCSGGTKSRTRFCRHLGKPQCAGKAVETKNCNSQRCPVHGNWSAWSNWSSCSTTCSRGVKVRQRQCDNPSPLHGGHPCQGRPSELKDCFVEHCPVRGNWGSWTKWSACSVTCATGQQHRRRVCNNTLLSQNGKTCQGKQYESRQCLRLPCPPQNWWSNWSHWSKCSKSCDVGEEKRTRQCLGMKPKNCIGVSIETKKCNLGACSVNGQWSHWQAWSSCSVSCNVGEQLRRRSCNNPSPEFGGKKCEGQETEMRACNLGKCFINGGWSVWSNWSACTVKCGKGLRIRTRKCNSPLPQNNGLNCSGDSIMVERCHVKCDFEPVWSHWNPWSTCSATCNTGHQLRWRFCHTKVFYKSANCSGNGPFQTQSRICEIQKCHYKAMWSMWTSWSECSRTCQGGTRTRQRFCLSKIVGINCSGENMKTEGCGIKTCVAKSNKKHPSVIKLGSPISCPHLGLFKNGRIKFINQHGSHFVIYSCNKYFNLKGPRYRHCEKDNQWSDSEPTCSVICGRNGFQPHDRLRIFGGQEVQKRGEWPWQVALEGNQGAFHCGGTLINEQWVLTAAHCLLIEGTYKIAYDRVKVYLGVLDITKRHRDKNVQFRHHTKIIFHQRFNWSTYDSDIALIKLNWRVNITENVRPVCLPNRAQRHQLKPGVKGTMVGWGEIEGGKPTTALRKVIMPIVGQRQCQRKYRQWVVTKNMVCAGYDSGNKDSCARDSGGGFLFYDRRSHKQRWFLGGIVSWGNPVCGTPGKYSVYTRMTHGYVRWIKQKIQEDQKHGSMLADGPKQIQ